MFTTDTLKNKVLLITGGGSGLGLSMAKRFAELGAWVVICGRNADKLKAATEQITNHCQYHGKSISHLPLSFQVDVREYDAVQAMVQTIVNQAGKLDGVVNNAAGNFLCASEDLSPNAFRTVIDIVLNGTFNVCSAFGQYVIAQDKAGVILNIVTTYTETGSAFVLPSACAKAGVLALTNSLAFEWAPFGIRCNAIAPGPFPTDGAWSRLMPNADFEKAAIDRNPMGRTGEHIELANLAAFLVSDLAPYINGANIPIDGGERLIGGMCNYMPALMERDALRQHFNSLRGKEK